LRLCGASAGGHEVAGAGEADHRLGLGAVAAGVAPDLGEDVAGGGARGVEALALGRARGERGGVLGGTGELDADGVGRRLAHDARAQEDLGDRGGERLVGRRGDQAGALVDHLARVRGAADDGDASLAELVAQQDARRAAVRGHEPLGERDHRGAWRAARPRAGRR
jgi:hypothetical protein